MMKGNKTYDKMRGCNTSANVKDVNVFRQLIDTTDTYVEECEERVEKIDDYIFMMDNEIHKIKDQLAQRLCDAEIKLRNCDNALTLCQARVSYDAEGHRQSPDCSIEVHARMKAKRQLEVARNNMNRMEELMRMADHFVNRFKESEQKFKDLLEIRLQDGNDSLKRLECVVIDYQNTKLNL